MPYFLRPYFLLIGLLLGTSFWADCQSTTQDSQTTEQTQVRRKQHRRSGARQRIGQIPQKVRDVLAYVRTNKKPMPGYVGGRRFGNFENHLPRSDTNGEPIKYQEWDVNPRVQGKNRGTQRLVTGSDGRAWYTNDHYNTFVEVNEV